MASSKKLSSVAALVAERRRDLKEVVKQKPVKGKKYKVML